ncbi:MAG: hypothetical protein J07AB43_10680 [Candidatus Nanosalina sp. J07AB43]|nr:MAG: hypothetical protein J07AB43_10680 [Candidatus Nanosalina sp. J07AB43]
MYEINWDGDPQSLNMEQQDAVKAMRNRLENRSFEGSDELDDMLYTVAEESDLSTGEFFQTAYRALLGRENGPRLSTLIVSIGQDQTTQILQKLV